MNKINAKAHFKAEYSEIHGVVYFDQMHGGTMITAHIKGLPKFEESGKPIGPQSFFMEVEDICIGKNIHTNINAEYGCHSTKNSNKTFPLLPTATESTGMRLFTDNFRPADLIGRKVFINKQNEEFRYKSQISMSNNLAYTTVTKQ